MGAVPRISKLMWSKIIFYCISNVFLNARKSRENGDLFLDKFHLRMHHFWKIPFPKKPINLSFIKFRWEIFLVKICQNCHRLSCKFQAGRHPRHSQLNDIVQRALSLTGLCVTFLNFDITTKLNYIRAFDVFLGILCYLWHILPVCPLKLHFLTKLKNFL